MSNVDYPFRIDGRGRSGLTDQQDHVRDLVEQVLFTSPGERVNRPTFGCGVQRLVFSGCSPEAAAAAEYIIRINITRFMSDVVRLDAVQVTADVDAATLYVDVLYTLLETGEERAETFRRTLEGAP